MVGHFQSYYYSCTDPKMAAALEICSFYDFKRFIWAINNASNLAKVHFQMVM